MGNKGEGSMYPVLFFCLSTDSLFSATHSLVLSKKQTVERIKGPALSLRGLRRILAVAHTKPGLKIAPRHNETCHSVYEIMSN